MTKVLCVSLECKHNCGDYVCEKRSHEDEYTITIMVGPYWRCDEYEEGDKNAENTQATDSYHRSDRYHGGTCFRYHHRRMPANPADSPHDG